jgi:hypothetical protein
MIRGSESECNPSSAHFKSEQHGCRLKSESQWHSLSGVVRDYGSEAPHGESEPSRGQGGLGLSGRPQRQSAGKLRAYLEAPTTEPGRVGAPAKAPTRRGGKTGTDPNREGGLGVGRRGGGGLRGDDDDGGGAVDRRVRSPDTIY